MKQETQVQTQGKIKIKGKTKRKIKNLVVNVERRERKELSYLTKVENSREKRIWRSKEKMLNVKALEKLRQEGGEPEHHCESLSLRKKTKQTKAHFLNIKVIQTEIMRLFS